MSNSAKSFEKLVEIMARLRAPDGCPWDREQTYKDIATHTLEETYEVIDAIDRGDFKDLKEELGDLLLQVVFYAQIAKEEDRFNIEDVIEGISKKLIHRHPHVFGDVKANNSSEVLGRWEKLKMQEGKKSVLGGVPQTLPALLKAYRIGEKASRVGFDWEDAEGILSKVEEEARELHEARKEQKLSPPPRLPHQGGGEEEAPQQTAAHDQVEHEYGDLLFTLANIGRFLKIDPESALRKATERFISRFQNMEKQIAEQQKEMQSLTPEEWDNLWEKAKQDH
ncbi:MAG: nucleoside triphosphate pyrophosphohydrolase [Pseudomonadota bacterium]